METKERIEVYIDVKNGKTVCICKRNRKGCKKKCLPDVVERDKFEGWESTFRRNRYGEIAPAGAVRERCIAYEDGCAAI